MAAYKLADWRKHEPHSDSTRTMTPDSIVQCRKREWVLLPSDRENLLLLRPLTGATDEVVARSTRASPTSSDAA
jgi:hypothetical protein